MSRYLDTSTKTNGLNHDPVWKMQSFFLSEIFTVILEHDYFLWERPFEKVLFRTQLGKSSKLGMLTSQRRKKGLFLSVYVDDFKLAGKTENIKPTWKILMKDVDLGEPTWAALKDNEYGGQLQEHVRIQNLCRSKRKATLFRET